jgi:predicted acetyltransferase
MAGTGKHKVARAISEREIEAHFQLMCAAFSLDESLARPIYFSDPFFDLTHKRVLVDTASEALLSCLTVVPASIRVAGGAILRMAGLAGVGTRPEDQRQGYASALLMATAEQISSELDYPLVALVTNQPDFYRRFGWERCSTAYDWSASPKILPEYAEGQAVRVLSPVEVAALAEPIHNLYEQVRIGQTGTLPRDSRRWFCIETFSRNRKVAIWQAQNGLEAYVAFEERDEDGKRTFFAHELIAESKAGRRALIGYLARRPEDEVVRGRMSATDFAAFGLDREVGIQVSLAEGMMLRITDLERCLIPIAESGHFTPILGSHPSGLTIRIDNAILSENNKPVRLFPIVDREHVTKLAMSPADEIEGLWISADVGAFTQLYIGYRSAAQLFSEGRLRASNAQAVSIADLLFPLSDPFLATPDTF